MWPPGNTSTARTMKLLPDSATGYSINSYGDGWVSINGERVALSKKVAESEMAEIRQGLETKLALEATYSDGSSRNVTADATLVSTDENIMTVTAEKAVRGVSTGTAFLAANLGDRSALVAVDVTDAFLALEAEFQAIAQRFADPG